MAKLKKRSNPKLGINNANIVALSPSPVSNAKAAEAIGFYARENRYIVSRTTMNVYSDGTNETHVDTYPIPQDIRRDNFAGQEALHRENVAKRIAEVATQK